MCIRPPCENCGADYNACMSHCPKCGHPNGEAPHYPIIQVRKERKKVYCKVCKKDHFVDSWNTIPQKEVT